MAEILFYIFIFPGILFLLVTSFVIEFIDRKLHARLQNRVGPPWFQPLADFIKLLGKEVVITDDADRTIFRTMPVVALTAAVTAFFYIPLWGTQAIYSFNGDLIVVLYLLTLPTLAFFLGGWYSRSVYAMIGASRALTQLFAYEVPLLLSVLASALLAGTWSLSELAQFYAGHTGWWLFNLVGFFVALIALLGKLEKVPFDIPEAETEIVAGYLTEYSGSLYAFIRLTLNIELIVGSALLAAVFFPWGLSYGPVAGFAFFILKLALIMGLITLLRSVLARFRIDQMIEFCWKYVSTVAFAQVIATLVIKGVLVR
ncbi:MAG: NADH-quinone oxidoreductase subunit H [Spirochaetes bacterium]|nr:MAG: NADH-quinone oxidoreductase subunit H [Spirochaetota bacterium]